MFGTPRRLLVYLVAVMSTASAALANAALWPELGSRYPLVAFFPAIAMSSWFGGFGPGALSTILAASAATYFWLTPPFSAGPSQQGEVIFLVFFVATGLTIAMLFEALRRRTTRAEDAERDALRLAAELRVSSQRLLDAEHAARQQAEHAHRVQNAFLATVSHELRTPLSAILGWTDVLKQKMVDEQRRDHALQAIYRSAHQQAQLLGDLLDASRLECGTFRLNCDRIDLGAIVRDAWDAIEPVADAKHIRATIRVDSAVAAIPFHADAVRVGQIMTNLFSNAVKFTSDGGAVLADVRLADGAIEIRVSDTGRGIAPDFLPLVFEAFRQADGTPGCAGFGLGLSIAKHLVEAHGGQIYAESDGLGRGARFTVRLPVTPAPVTTRAESLASV